MLLLISSTALASSSSPTRAPDHAKVVNLAAEITQDRGVLRFFRQHRWLLSDPRFSAEAHRQIASHRTHLAHALAEQRARQAARRHPRHARRLTASRVETPREVICRIFGSRCGEALQVARCESRFHTDAQNGQYYGLFQMGTNERRIFGDGASAEEQARAAFRYFVVSGRDWSPWACKPW